MPTTLVLTVKHSLWKNTILIFIWSIVKFVVMLIHKFSSVENVEKCLLHWSTFNNISGDMNTIKVWSFILKLKLGINHISVSIAVYLLMQDTSSDIMYVFTLEKSHITVDIVISHLLTQKACEVTSYLIQMRNHINVRNVVNVIRGKVNWQLIWKFIQERHHTNVNTAANRLKVNIHLDDMCYATLEKDLTNVSTARKHF